MDDRQLIPGHLPGLGLDQFQIEPFQYYFLYMVIGKFDFAYILPVQKMEMELIFCIQDDRRIAPSHNNDLGIF